MGNALLTMTQGYAGAGRPYNASQVLSGLTYAVLEPTAGSVVKLNSWDLHGAARVYGRATCHIRINRPAAQVAASSSTGHAESRSVP